MASLRLAGASPVTSRPSMEMVPLLVSSSPAISLSSVDLPQPEGPTKTTNSPFSISRSSSGMIVVAPKDFDTFLRDICPIVSSRYSWTTSLGSAVSPPSGLPAISPSRGEIGRLGGGAPTATSADGEGAARRRNLPP